MNVEKLLAVPWKKGMWVEVLKADKYWVLDSSSIGDIGQIYYINHVQLYSMRKRLGLGLGLVNPLSADAPIQVLVGQNLVWMSLDAILPITQIKEAPISLPDII